MVLIVVVERVGRRMVGGVWRVERVVHVLVGEGVGEGAQWRLREIRVDLRRGRERGQSLDVFTRLPTCCRVRLLDCYGNERTAAMENTSAQTETRFCPVKEFTKNSSILYQKASSNCIQTFVPVSLFIDHQSGCVSRCSWSHLPTFASLHLHTCADADGD